MSRAGVTLAAFLILSAWAGGQGPSSLTAADHIRLLRMNRVLISDLVDCGVKLGSADRTVDRAESCREAARVLGVALRGAADAQDVDRVAELGDHLDTLVSTGLVPVLNEARDSIPPQSPDAKKLKQVRKAAADDLDWARAGISEGGKIGENGTVRSLRGRLDGLRERLE